MRVRMGRGAFAASLLALMLVGCGSPRLAVGAASQVGVAALQHRAIGDSLTDAQIRLRLGALLLEEHEQLFTSVRSEVVEGRVLLLGRVPLREDKVTVVRLAWSIGSVREVIDALETVETPRSTTVFKDLRIEGQVALRLLNDIDVRSHNFNIEAIDGVVHLIGLATTRQELRRAATLSSTVAGVARVVSHVYLTTDPRRLRHTRPGQPI
ncbi:MAG: BON domain-containing protein [Pseudomonadota bacterium]